MFVINVKIFIFSRFTYSRFHAPYLAPILSVVCLLQELVDFIGTHSPKCFAIARISHKFCGLAARFAGQFLESVARERDRRESGPRYQSKLQIPSKNGANEGEGGRRGGDLRPLMRATDREIALTWRVRSALT